MATIKSYTDINQSKKLAEILPIESSDMYYPYDLDSHKVLNIPIVKDDYCMPCIHCWSLAALYNILPYKVEDDKGNVAHLSTFKMEGNKIKISYYDVLRNYYYLTTDVYDNFVDACVDMIIKLKERNLI